jgi:hypothetical protein
MARSSTKTTNQRRAGASGVNLTLLRICTVILSTTGDRVGTIWMEELPVPMTPTLLPLNSAALSQAAECKRVPL